MRASLHGHAAATSDIGASNGDPPVGEVTVSVRDGDRAAGDQRLGLIGIGGEMQIVNSTWPGGIARIRSAAAP